MVPSRGLYGALGFEGRPFKGTPWGLSGGLPRGLYVAFLNGALKRTLWGL